jgi:hypothetical protein
MITRRILMIGALAFAASFTLVLPASAENKSKSCGATATVASCTPDDSCDPACCDDEECCEAHATATKQAPAGTQAADAKPQPKAACTATAPAVK